MNKVLHLSDAGRRSLNICCSRIVNSKKILNREHLSAVDASESDICGQANRRLADGAKSDIYDRRFPRVIGQAAKALRSC